MKNILSLMALGIMFTGSVLADSTNMEQQKMQIQEQEDSQQRAIKEGFKTGNTPDEQDASQKKVTVQNRRDLVGMALDDKKEDPSVIGSDHIIEMNDDKATGQEKYEDTPDTPMTVDGR